MVPYVIAPEYFWSAGSYRLGDPDQRDLVADVAFDATDTDLRLLSDRGFCAVVYDRNLGSRAIDQQVPLAGRSITTRRTPDYSDGRYLVYLLDG